MKVTDELLQTSSPAYQNNGQAELAQVSNLTEPYLMLLDVAGRSSVLRTRSTFAGTTKELRRPPRGAVVLATYLSSRREEELHFLG